MFGFDVPVLGLVFCVFSGLVLGMIGGGGAILMVPILHYIFGLSASDSVIVSMAVVGTTSFIGSLAYFRSNEVNLKIGVLFAIPSLIAVTIVRIYVLPAIPSSFVILNEFYITKDKLTLTFFAVVMLSVAIAMVRPSNVSQNFVRLSLLRIILSSVGVGALTGFVGAGGGFLIVPTFHLLLKLPLRTAIGTSLFVIFLNSLFGVLSEFMNGTSFPVSLSLVIVSMSVLGMLCGLRLSKGISPNKLKNGFAVFVVFVALAILAKEFSWF